MAGHTIVWEYSYHTVQGTLHCDEPPTADCRLTPGQGCACESWVIQRDSDGTPWHWAEGWDGPDDTPVRHEMRILLDRSECNIKLYLEEDLEELAVEGTRFVIGETAVDGVWTGDGYQWELAEVESAQDGLKVGKPVD